MKRFFRPCFPGLVAASLCLVVAAPHGAWAQSASAQNTGDSISWDVARQDRRITALAQDKRGRIFAASEESGVWMRGTSRNSDKLWRRFTTQNSRQLADDNIYALAVDQQNRVWAGTASHGVSVFNGRAWKNYDVLQAPIGERIFDIAICPTDGDVWIASNAGLTRYSVAKDLWTTFYPAARLPFNHIQALTFDAQGNIVVGTQTDGVLLAEAKNEYSKWRVVSFPDSALAPGSSASGDGLPSNMTSDVLAARDGTIWVATPNGLAWSRDKGRTWRWTRGADYSDKMSNRWDLQRFKVQHTLEPPTWSEDYISCLAEDGAGMLWIGHWRKGYQVYNPKTQTFVLNGAPDAPGAKSDDPQSNGDGDYVKCILPLSGQAPLIGRYGFGLTIAPRFFDRPAETKTSATATSASSTQSWLDVAPFPSVQQAPKRGELNALLRQLSMVPVQAPRSAHAVVSLDDDWTTRGDWLGRYGRYWANLCAMVSPQDYIWGAGYKNIRYVSRIGPNADKSDSIRYWVQELYNNNPNTLEIPPVYLDSRIQAKLTTPDRNRRQAEIDDHGEAYPYVKDGPHLYCSLQVPPGTWTLSLYDWNKDGDSGDNRKRDYRVSIRRHNANKLLDDISDFEQQPELARARIRDFRRGVWKRFLVRGPQELTIEVSKNSSFNTILAGVMLDELKETPAPYFRTVQQDRVLEAQQAQRVVQRVQETPVLRARHFAGATTEAETAKRLCNELDELRRTNPLWHAQQSRRFYLPLTLWLEQAQASARDKGASQAEMKTINTQLGSCYYQMRMFDKWEKCQRGVGLTPARDIEKSLRWDGVKRGRLGVYNTVLKPVEAPRQESSTRSGKTLPIEARSNGNVR